MGLKVYLVLDRKSLLIPELDLCLLMWKNCKDIILSQNKKNLPNSLYSMIQFWYAHACADKSLEGYRNVLVNYLDGGAALTYSRG